MKNNKIDFKYFYGEKTNPFTCEEDCKLNKHMWWHYESHYADSTEDKERFPCIDDFIKFILANKLDYGDNDGRMFKQYCDNRVIK